MARIDTLTNFLTDVADSIRAKTGSSELIQASSFDTAIDNIPSGGGSTFAEPDDVNFYDYDGTLLKSYNKSAFLALSAMPDNPSHAGLTAQGWNWTLSDAQTFVTSNDKLDIGQNYITTDGKTRIYVSLVDPYNLEPRLSLNATTSFNITIDWGDGTTPEDATVTNGTYVGSTFVHNYATTGDYVITITPKSTVGYLQIAAGSQYSGTAIFWRGQTSSTKKYYTQNRYYQSCVKKIELGERITLGTRALESCIGLQSITLPNWNLQNNVPMHNFTINAFFSCLALKGLILPKSITSISQDSIFSSCQAIRVISLPKETTNVGGISLFSGCYALPRIVFPNGIFLDRAGTFGSCKNLMEVIMPGGFSGIFGTSTFAYCTNMRTISGNITSVGSNAFQDCNSLGSVVFTGNVTSVGSYAFQSCSCVQVFDFSHCTGVPTLQNYNAFDGDSDTYKIVVPDSLYETWIATSQWSTSIVVSHITKASDYFGS